MGSEDLRILTKDDIEKLERMEQDIKRNLEYLSLCFKVPVVINISDISKVLKVSRTQLLGKQAYLLPNYGRKSDFPDGPMRWKISTWTEWNSRSVDERKREYETLLRNDRIGSRK